MARREPRWHQLGWDKSKKRIFLACPTMSVFGRGGKNQQTALAKAALIDARAKHARLSLSELVSLIYRGTDGRLLAGRRCLRLLPVDGQHSLALRLVSPSKFDQGVCDLGDLFK